MNEKLSVFITGVRINVKLLYYTVTTSKEQRQLGTVDEISFTEFHRPKDTYRLELLKIPSARWQISLLEAFCELWSRFRDVNDVS